MSTLPMSQKAAFLRHLRMRASIILQRFRLTRIRSQDDWRATINAYMESTVGQLDMIRTATGCGLTVSDVARFGALAFYQFITRNGRLTSFAFQPELMWADYQRSQPVR